MTDLYYYTHKGMQFGPFSAVVMREQAAVGGILLTDFVWREGTERRVLAAKVQHLFAGPPADPPCESASSGSDARPGTDEPAVVVDEPAAAAAVLPPTVPVPNSARRVPAPMPVRKKRVVSIKGAILVSQDGSDVKFRKKCSVCNHEDSCRSSLKIPKGASRSTFFCPQCRKMRAVEIVGAC
jgi:hypothetical protein